MECWYSMYHTSPPPSLSSYPLLLLSLSLPHRAMFLWTCRRLTRAQQSSATPLLTQRCLLSLSFSSPSSCLSSSFLFPLPPISPAPPSPPSPPLSSPSSLSSSLPSPHCPPPFITYIVCLFVCLYVCLFVCLTQNNNYLLATFRCTDTNRLEVKVHTHMYQCSVTTGVQWMSYWHSTYIPTDHSHECYACLRFFVGTEFMPTL